MGFTQPLCHDCWNRDNPDSPVSATLIDPDEEKCCKCGDQTTSGIYIRVDPKTVPYPTKAV